MIAAAPPRSGPAHAVRRRRSGSSPAALVLVCVAVFLLGSGIVLEALARPHALYGITEYDDGVYLGAALRLVGGSLPYRDFAFVQPPGIVLLLAPIARLAGGSRQALADARILTAVVAGANCCLAAAALRHRGVVAALAGGAALACFPTAYYADHTVLLEPYLGLFCLIGLNLAFSAGALAGRTRLLLAGAALGLGVAVKLWALLVVAAFACVALLARRRALLPLLIGGCLGFLALSLPFFCLSPGGFVADVFSSQFSRNAGGRTSLTLRLEALTGLVGYSTHLRLVRHRRLVDVVAGALAVLALLPAALSGLCRRLSDFDAVVALALAAVVGAFFVPGQFYAHYAYFSACLLVLALGSLAGRLAAGVVRAASAAGRGRGALVLAGGGLLLLGALAGVASVVSSETVDERSALSRTVDKGPLLARAIPAGSCAVSDAAILLIEADRFTTSPGCPAVVDPTGAWLALAPGSVPGADPAAAPRLVAAWSRWFAEARYVVLSAPGTTRIPWTPALRRRFTAEYRLLAVPDEALYGRRTGSR